MEHNKNHKSESELPLKTALDGNSKKEIDPKNPNAKNEKTDDETNDKSSDNFPEKKPLVIDEKIVLPSGNQEQKSTESISNSSENITF